MAFDFYSSENYNVDYYFIKNNLSQNIFKTKKYSDLYINSWIKVLKNCEKQPNLDKEWIKKQNYYVAQKGRYEYFELELFESTFKIFFDIENIQKYFKNISNIHEFKINDYISNKLNIIANPKSQYEYTPPSKKN